MQQTKEDNEKDSYQEAREEVNKKVDQGAQEASSNKTDKPSENLEVKSDEASVEKKGE